MGSQQEDEQPPRETGKLEVPIIGKLALICAIVSFISQGAYLTLCSELLTISAYGMARPQDLVRWRTAMETVGSVGLLLGWYFFVCACLARGFKGRWGLGCVTLIVLLAATVESLTMV